MHCNDSGHDRVRVVAGIADRVALYLSSFTALLHQTADLISLVKTNPDYIDNC